MAQLGLGGDWGLVVERCVLSAPPRGVDVRVLSHHSTRAHCVRLLDGRERKRNTAPPPNPPFTPDDADRDLAPVHAAVLAGAAHGRDDGFRDGVVQAALDGGKVAQVDGRRERRGGRHIQGDCFGCDAETRGVERLHEG